MVFVNSKKFACESCIKGHRSSSCHHTERPLFEVKKKGRPVSQCETCRELRQSRRVHSKCTCKSKQNEPKRVPLQSSSQPDKKPKRFIPIVPSLPNGLKDALQSSSSTVCSDSRQRVSSLLNPCHCQDVRRCRCRSMAPGPSTAQHMEEDVQTGLATLAQAAAMCCGSNGDVVGGQLYSKSTQTNVSRVGREDYVGCGRWQDGDDYGRYSRRDTSRFNLPPISVEMMSGSEYSSGMPEFSVIPPISAITSIAGSGCTCGLFCACPGCVEHRGVEHVSREREDCPDRCGSCVDYSGGIELPGQGSSGGSRLMDEFFARAASLPRPPRNRKVGMELDGMNMMVYPNEVFRREGGTAFGLVQVPKLERCGGVCGCGKACEGCCSGQTSGL
ncbi:hypothetical protein SERLA73DRAFT_176212 [Serpula lacrymans var. lacrymans S7.3]|uniref:Copper-fist domain-containing protein n=2 Tax=Serpula lacrymans var. lacrymans TaxID=341189 RepID=F8PMI5_SERL3|nr:uncharacterized protein SERLADRAFT_459002 [Serpula lacrymans var. lacrymans S7.9]EGO02817.1 hypothetical protein SERLA73DRAFT_176212 [Serpula lacrymans var. lacrymans S7.3]EGO28519.1 hypothetical protein SERLADRAFT_459002 [Serpula lacrymans var. lacrymans S7.9]